MSEPLVIYIAGPYTAPTPKEVEANVERAVQAGVECMRRGHNVYVPHLSHYLELSAVRINGVGIPYERWMWIDHHWLEQCDALLYLAPSPGADRELAHAQERYMTVFRNLDQVPVAKMAI